MIENMIHKIVKQKIKALEKSDYDEKTIDITMKTSLNKYFENYKAVDVKNINLVKPTETDLLLYLIYLWQEQKQNDIEALKCINDIVNFKISLHKDDIQQLEVDSLFDLYKTQIQLK